MTAPDHTIKLLENFLRDRGHPYMFHGCPPSQMLGAGAQPGPRFDIIRAQPLPAPKVQAGAITASKEKTSSTLILANPIVFAQRKKRALSAILPSTKRLIQSPFRKFPEQHNVKGVFHTVRVNRRRRERTRWQQSPSIFSIP